MPLRAGAGARLINASSAATYGDGSRGFSDSLLTTLSLRPLNGYGYSKQLFDLWAYRENLLNRIATVKFFNVYGPNEYHKGDMKSVACKAFTELRKPARSASSNRIGRNIPTAGRCAISSTSRTV